MKPQEMDFDAEVANRIKSIFNTVRKYHATSTALQGRGLHSLRILASARGDEVVAIGEKWPDSPIVQKWVDKYLAFMDQHDLWT